MGKRGRDRNLGEENRDLKKWDWERISCCRELTPLIICKEETNVVSSRVGKSPGFFRKKPNPPGFFWVLWFFFGFFVFFCFFLGFFIFSGFFGLFFGFLILKKVLSILLI